MRAYAHPLAAVAVAALLAVAGCGGSDDSRAQESDPGVGQKSQAEDTGMAMGEMNDPDATPANELDGAHVQAGRFTMLDTAPPGLDNVRGRAWLAQGDMGTTVTIELSGLAGGEEYVAHLHEQSCDQDNGGDHFAFDSNGPAEPPNEVHLGFTADEQGNGGATVTNDRKVGEGAKSVVVHPAEMMDNRVACADF